MGGFKLSNVEEGTSSTFRAEKFKPDSCYGARHTQMILLFSLTTLAYIMRVVLSVGIVAMTDPNASSNPDIPTYDWDDKGFILSSFFVGYVMPQIAAGQLAKYYGPKYFLGTTAALGSVVCILIPVAAKFGSNAVIVCRVLQGLCQGFMFPSCHHLLSKWVPPMERARLSSFVYAGTSFGTVISLVLTGWICGSDLGWPVAFYLYGVMGLIWCAVWFFLGKNSPKEHKSINLNEKYYIELSLNETENQEPVATPWKDILTSLPFWALIIAQSGQNWGFTTLLTNIPSFMASVLNYDISTNGFLSAGPYFAFWVLSFVFSPISDWAITNKVVSVALGRKIANSIGSLVPALSLIILGIIGSNSTDIATQALILLFTAVGINSMVYCGHQVNHMDIAPAHAGTLMGISNALSNIMSIFGPLIIQFIVTNENDAFQWAIVFYIAAVIYFAGNTFFIIFASGTIQSWNYPKNDLIGKDSVISEKYRTDQKEKY